MCASRKRGRVKRRMGGGRTRWRILTVLLLSYLSTPYRCYNAPGFIRFMMAYEVNVDSSLFFSLRFFLFFLLRSRNTRVIEIEK